LKALSRFKALSAVFGLAPHPIRRNRIAVLKTTTSEVSVFLEYRGYELDSAVTKAEV
jgi:hypothetical protein